MPRGEPDDVAAAFAVHFKEAEEETVQQNEKAEESNEEDSAAERSRSPRRDPSASKSAGASAPKHASGTSPPLRSRSPRCRKQEAGDERCSLSGHSRSRSPRRGVEKDGEEAPVIKVCEDARYEDEAMAEKLEGCAETEDAGPECKGRVCTFTKGVSLLDDILHRGVALQDMDFYHYAKFIERTPIPHREDVLALHAQVGQFFVFEPHYCMSARFVQTLRSRRKVVRFIGPNCQRSNVNEGEENAQYKAFLFSTVRCTGCGECANPLLFRSALAMKANRRFGFAPAWKARRAEIEVLADRAQAKKREARRVEVLQDTTAFRAYREQVRKPPDGQPADGATEHFQSPDGKPADGVTEHFLKHVELRKFMHLHTANYKACCGLYEYHVPHANSERIVALISEYAELGVPWHREQLHLAEFVALRTREILFNSDLSVDAKNMAAQKAARHRGLVTEAEAEDPEPRVEQWRGDGEDVEGNIPDEDHVEMDGEESGHERNGEACKQVLQSKLLDILTRKAEIAQASASGHTRDMYKDMKKVHDIFA